jgi:HopA1 effector protein family
MAIHVTTPSLALDARLMAALRSLVILSPQEFTFEGRRMPAVPQPDLSGGVTPQHAMISALQAQLYGTVYNRAFSPAVPPASPPSLTNITLELSRVNPGRERWDHGWQVYQTLPSGMIQAHKHGRAQMFYPGQYMPVGATPGAQAPVQGTIVSVYLAKEMRNFQDGFYIALGEQVQPYYEQTSLVRVYWNIRPDGAIPIVSELVGRFNRFQVPFRFKCLAYTELYERFDAAVLFVGRRRWDIAALLIAEIYPRLKAHLRPDIPLFTKRLAPGLALAEDPASGESFGTSRCRLIAEGLWQAYQRGLQTESARVDEIANAFRRAGIALEHPWLNPGSMDIYDVHVD